MKKLIIEHNKLQIVTQEVPTPQLGERLIKVIAVGLNRLDLFMLQGLFAGDAPGIELIGVDIISQQLVMALLPQGAMAEYVAIHEEALCYIPTLPSTFQDFILAAWPEALAVAANTILNGTTGNRILLQTAGGIMNILAVIAKQQQMEALLVTSNKKYQFCEQLGVSLINYEEDHNWWQYYKNSCDILIDTLGGEAFSNAMKCLAPGGIAYVMGVLETSNANVNLASILLKNNTIQGFTIKDKNAAVKRALLARAWEKCGDDIINGKLVAPIDKIYPFTEYNVAFTRLLERKNYGKIILLFNEA